MPVVAVRKTSDQIKTFPQTRTPQLLEPGRSLSAVVVVLPPETGDRFADKFVFWLFRPDYRRLERVICALPGLARSSELWDIGSRCWR